MQQISKITLAWELVNEGVSQTQIARRLGVHRETIGLWLKTIRNEGLLKFLNQYQNAKKGERKKRQTDPLLKRLVWRIREEERGCCGQKIGYFLRTHHQINLSTSKIYEILAEKYVLRSKWKKNRVRGAVPRATQSREVIQMDSVDFGAIFAFTAVDIFSKEADVLLVPALTAHHSCRFLNLSMERRFDGYVYLLQTDGGPEFKQEFKVQVHRFCNRHRVARPYKKNEQAYIESFNRSLRKECLGWGKHRPQEIPELTREVESYLNWYHYHRPYLGLNLKTPLTIT